ncbi:hypothetical protein [Lysobacter gummosus]
MVRRCARGPTGRQWLDAVPEVRSDRLSWYTARGHRSRPECCDLDRR